MRRLEVLLFLAVAIGALSSTRPCQAQAGPLPAGHPAVDGTASSSHAAARNDSVSIWSIPPFWPFPLAAAGRLLIIGLR